MVLAGAHEAAARRAVDRRRVDGAPHLGPWTRQILARRVGVHRGRRSVRRGDGRARSRRLCLRRLRSRPQPSRILRGRPLLSGARQPTHFSWRADRVASGQTGHGFGVGHHPHWSEGGRARLAAWWYSVLDGGLSWCGQLGFYFGWYEEEPRHHRLRDITGGHASDLEPVPAEINPL